MKRELIEILSTGIYVGFFQIAPGTLGSVWAIPLVYFLSTLSVRTGVVLIFGLIAGSLWLSNEGEKIFGRKDPQEIVIDEIAGLTLALYLVPLDPGNIVGVFLIFRIVDIFKPFPIKWIERRLYGGLGVVADDLMASLYTVSIWYFMNLIFL